MQRLRGAIGVGLTWGAAWLLAGLALLVAFVSAPDATRIVRAAAAEAASRPAVEALRMQGESWWRLAVGYVGRSILRTLAADDTVTKALTVLKGRARIKRTMWSRRAQEYEAKINSGDLISIAEVVRDLYRSESQPEQSYSERQLYEAALDRLSREIAVVQHSTETEAVKEIESQLSKSPRRGAKTETAGADGEADEADVEADGDESTVADEAA